MQHIFVAHELCGVMLSMKLLRMFVDYRKLVFFTARRNARIASAVLATAIPSVRLSV